MDKIVMKGLVFHGRHGILEEERRAGQRFVLDIELHVDLRTAGAGDRLEDTVDYSAVYSLVKEIVETRTYRLLEALGENIACGILDRFPPVQETGISLRKPDAPVPGTFDYFGIEIRRKRGE